MRRPVAFLCFLIGAGVVFCGCGVAAAGGGTSLFWLGFLITAVSAWFLTDD